MKVEFFYILFLLLFSYSFQDNIRKLEEKDTKSEDIIILHTNDVHCGVQDQIGYDGLLFYKKQLQKKYKYVLTVDCGDHIQGSSLGLLTNGKAIIDIMNEINFDVVTIGNHEFDYGVETLLELNQNLNCGYISSNIFYRKNKTALFPGYKIITLDNNKKIAFIGITTPLTLTKTSLINIVDDDNKPIYDFLTEGYGTELYSEVQKNINKVRQEGANYVILLAHLGKDIDGIYGYSSLGLMEHLENVDAILDGHSHQVYSITTPDKNKKNIILAQTGTKLNYLGVLTIHTNGTLTHELLDTIPLIDENYDKDSYINVVRNNKNIFVDKNMNLFIQKQLDSLDYLLNENIGYSPFTLTINEQDPKDKSIIIYKSRTSESPLCNLVTDSLRAIGNGDITMMNAGTVRTDLEQGNITYHDILDIMPFSNDLEIKKITGQTILDALEFGVKELPKPASRFPQVSGMRYKVNIDINSSVIIDENGAFIKVGGKRRVFNVFIGDELLDPNKNYTMSTHIFFSQGGGGYSMFNKYEVIRNGFGVDNEALIDYIKKDLKGIIPDKYKNPEGRIIIVNGTDANIRLISFGGYNNDNNNDAKEFAYFKNIEVMDINLKQYLKFTVDITYDNNLKNLEENKKFNAIGIKTKDENGIIIYNITYEGTKGLNIKNINSNNNYCFYNEGQENKCDNTTIIGEAEMMVKESIMIHDIEKDDETPLIEYGTKTIYLNIIIKDDIFLEYKEPKQIKLNYININENKENEIACMLTNIDKEKQKYQISCNPKESINTHVNSLIFKYMTSPNKLRLLSNENIIHYYGINIAYENDVIKFDYSPSSHHNQKTSKKNKLIVLAIVLPSVAVVICLIILVCFLKNRNKNISNNSTVKVMN